MIVVIGLIVYFTVFYHKDKGTEEVQNQVAKMAPIVKRSIRDYFNKEYWSEDMKVYYRLY